MAAQTKTFLGGDDVRAVVVDCGSWAVRFGSAGDDSPKAILPSAVGFPHPRPAAPGHASAGADVEMSDAAAAQTPALTVPPATAGDVLLSAPTLFRDVQPVYTHDPITGDAAVASWDHMAVVWRAAYKSLRLEPEHGPLLIVEPTRMWRARDRAAALEAAFEGMRVPAAYVARGSAMAAFASARVSACVLDIGAQGATAVPVVDGYALQGGVQRGRVGGALLAERAAEWAEACLEPRPGYDGQERGPGKRMRGDHGKKDRLLRAAHEIKRERIHGDDPVRRYRVTDLTGEGEREFTAGHRHFYRLRVMDDLKACAMEIRSDGPDGPDAAAAGNGLAKGKSVDGTSADGLGNGAASGTASGNGTGNDDSGTGEDGGAEQDKKGGDKERDDGKWGGAHAKEYTLPDGNVLSLGERGGVEIGELLFGRDGELERRSVSALVVDCIARCDVDVRREMWGGVVVAGGCSLMDGVVERVTREVAARTPQAYKVKVTAGERGNAAWIGGSIVSSLGTFHNAWVSKAEYDELGAQGALRKCP